MEVVDFPTRLTVALICGTAIGVERQLRQRQAGLHTCTLVASGSALFLTVAARADRATSRIRVAPQGVTGVGFWGARRIVRSGRNVRGLNTAGALRCSAAAGVLAGMGHGPQGAIGTAGVLVIHAACPPRARLQNRQGTGGAKWEAHQLFTGTCREGNSKQLRPTLMQFLHDSHLRWEGLETVGHLITEHPLLKTGLAAQKRYEADKKPRADRPSVEPRMAGPTGRCPAGRVASREATPGGDRLRPTAAAGRSGPA